MLFILNKYNCFLRIDRIVDIESMLPFVLDEHNALFIPILNT